MSENRQAFERFISSPPFEKDIERFPTGDAKYPWPGAYRDITVELAWECWREATFSQAAQFEAQLAEAEAKIPRWIPVKERLPKPGATVLAVDNSGNMGVCTFVNAKFVGECFGFEAYLNNGGWDRFASKIIGEYVTHWMTPEPPKSGRGSDGF